MTWVLEPYTCLDGLTYDGDWHLHMLATCIVFILEDVH